jgi:integrase
MAWIHSHVSRDGETTWHVQWRDPKTGAKKSRALGAVPREAALAEAAVVARAEEGRRPKAVHATALVAYARFRAHWKFLGRSARTLDFYDRNLRDTLEALTVRRPLAALEPADLRAYLVSHPAAPRSHQMRIVACRTFTKFCSENGIECPQFAAGVRGPPVVVHEAEHYTEADMAKLLRWAKGKKAEVPIACALLAGLSLGDLRALPWSTVTRWLDAGLVSGKRVKTGRTYQSALSSRLHEVLARRRPKKAKGLACDLPPSQQGAEQLLRRSLVLAGVEPGGWHRLRHSFGTALAAHADLGTLRLAMGHAPGSTMTLRYVHGDPTRSAAAIEEMDRAIGG